jgi:hypothetical protein
MDYRLYFMTYDGHIRHGMDLQCDDDEQAIALVESRRELGPLELWERGRPVKVFPADRA